MMGVTQKVGIKTLMWQYVFPIISGVALLYGWLMTLPGLQLTIGGLSYFLPGLLSVKEIQGCLGGSIQVKQLTYQGATSQLKLRQLSIQLKKRSLLKGKFHIQRLSVIDLNMTSLAKDDSLPHFFWLLKRFRIDHAEIKNFTFENTKSAFQMAGGIGAHQILKWQFKDPNFQLKGQLKTYAGQNPYGQLVAHSIPVGLSDQKMPALKMTARYQNATGLVHIITTDSDRPVNEISLKATQIKGLFIRSLVALQINATCRDFTLLQQIGLPFKNGVCVLSSGPITIDFRFQDTLKHLEDYLKNSATHFLKRYLPRPFPKSAKLSIDWKAPHLLSWGAFESLTLEGKLHQHCIAWEAQLTEILKTDIKKSPSKWHLRGKTQYQFNKTSKKALWWESLKAETHLKLCGDALKLFSDKHYALSASPDVDITIHDRKISLLGKACITEAHFKLTDTAFTMKRDPDIYFVLSDNGMRSEPWQLDVQVNLGLGKDIFLSYSGLKARLAGYLVLNKHNAQPMTAKGDINIIEGDYYAFGQTLKLSEDSRFIFTEQLYNPNLDIKATRAIDIKPSNRLPSFPSDMTKPYIKPLDCPAIDLKLPLPATVGVHLRGALAAPTMHLFSKPPNRIINPVDRLSYVLTGQPAYNLGEDPLVIVWNTAAYLSDEYINKVTTAKFLKQLRITMDIESERSRNRRLTVSKQLTSEAALLWKIGCDNVSHAIDIHYLMGKHMMAGVGIGLYRAGSGLDINYQYEWD